MRKLSFAVSILLGTLIGAAVGTATSYLLPTRFESTAVLRVVPSQLPERFVGVPLSQPIRQRLKPSIAALLSRTSLQTIIEIYGLYPQERKRLPMEDVIETMAKDVRVSTESEDSQAIIHLSFQYEDRLLARRVVSALTSQLIERGVRIQKSDADVTVGFLRDMVEEAAHEWLALKQGKGAGADRSELRALDLELARKRYESMRQKLSEVEVLNALYMRNLGELLEVVDQPSLPQKPISPRREPFLAGGAVLGLMAALVVVLAKKH